MADESIAGGYTGTRPPRTAEPAEIPSSTPGGDRLRVTMAYAGGVLGPLGGGVVSPMMLQIGLSLHASTSEVATSLTTYFVAFAAAQLVSGTLGERWGRKRTVRTAYLVYAVGSVACALAPNLSVLLVMRAVLGVANAFTSPLLLAGLADIVPKERLSRSVGIYASCLAAGQSFAPLVGGLAAGSSWRLGFVVVAVAAAVLALFPPPGEPRPGASAPPWRPLISRRMAWLSAAAFASYMGASALPFLVSVYAEEHLGLGSGVTGVVVLGFGLAGLLLGASWGSLTDRYGAKLCGTVAAVVSAVFVTLCGITGSGVTLALAWLGAGVSASMVTVALQNLTVRAVPGNRSGSLSAVSAFRYSGSAIAPLCWLPIYNSSPSASFVAAGATALLAAVALPLVRTGPEQPARAGA
ncbi:MFS transporter [Streptomyces sp. NBC_00669]|uniref:MFS transporter n=1 Tax=unclassified Streptomyces TaxID=2593676 RepID=UPI002E2ED084|nr:MFS transporter [Streptomyces sp. NBC_00669]